MFNLNTCALKSMMKQTYYFFMIKLIPTILAFIIYYWIATTIFTRDGNTFWFLAFMFLGLVIGSIYVVYHAIRSTIILIKEWYKNEVDKCEEEQKRIEKILEEKSIYDQNEMDAADRARHERENSPWIER